MQAYRWIADSRDEKRKERLEKLDNSFIIITTFKIPST